MLMLDTKRKVETGKCALCVSTHFHLVFYLQVPIWHKTSNNKQIFLQLINTDDTHVTIATKTFCNICH